MTNEIKKYATASPETIANKMADVGYESTDWGRLRAYLDLAISRRTARLQRTALWATLAIAAAAVTNVVVAVIALS